MRDEVSMVVKFISQSMIKDRLPTGVVGKLCEKLTKLLFQRYTNHWHPRNPLVSSPLPVYFLFHGACAHMLVVFNGAVASVAAAAAALSSVNLGAIIRDFFRDPPFVS
jgi:hypothetical protein